MRCHDNFSSPRCLHRQRVSSHKNINSNSVPTMASYHTRSSLRCHHERKENQAGRIPVLALALFALAAQEVQAQRAFHFSDEICVFILKYFVVLHAFCLPLGDSSWCRG
jgi:hypothetical protein